MKNQKGFIQIPILIAIIIVSAIVFGGGGYFIAHKMSQSQQTIPKSDTVASTTETDNLSGDTKSNQTQLNTSAPAKPAPLKVAPPSLYNQYKAETTPSSQSASSIRYTSESTILYALTIDQSGGTNLAFIKSLDKGIQVTFMNDVHKDWSKISVDGQVGWVFSSSLISGEPTTPKLSEIIKKWRPIVGYVECDFRDTNTNELYSQVSGSGVVIDFDGQITVITNRHVIVDKNNYQPFICRVKLPNDSNTFIGQKFMGGGAIDIGLIDINNPDEYIKNLTSISNSPLNFCRQKPSLGDSVLILGYPSIGSQTDITATEGIVSGFDGNYFITSAKIEHGDSGGVAILPKGDCYLGIPTGVVAGELESLGRILDINAPFPK